MCVFLDIGHVVDTVNDFEKIVLAGGLRLDVEFLEVEPDDGGVGRSPDALEFARILVGKARRLYHSSFCITER